MKPICNSHPCPICQFVWEVGILKFLDYSLNINYIFMQWSTQLFKGFYFKLFYLSIPHKKLSAILSNIIFIDLLHKQLMGFINSTTLLILKLISFIELHITRLIGAINRLLKDKCKQIFIIRGEGTLKCIDEVLTQLIIHLNKSCVLLPLPGSAVCNGLM